MHQTISAYVPEHSLNGDLQDDTGKPERQQKGYGPAESSLQQEERLQRAQFGSKTYYQEDARFGHQA